MASSASAAHFDIRESNKYATKFYVVTTPCPEKKSSRFTIYNLNKVKYIFIIFVKNYPDTSRY